MPTKSRSSRWCRPSSFRSPPRRPAGLYHHPPGEKLGTVELPVSCAPGVAVDFNRATALLPSFAYQGAEAAYAAPAAREPACATAHWGVAMTQFHPIWAAANASAAPSLAEVAKGRAAIEKARAAARRGR